MATHPKLPTSKLLIFSLPAIPIAIMHVPTGAIIPGFYAKHTGISLATIGLIFLATRIFDAVTDPMIGYLSDRFNTRFGRRKPWVFVGALMAAVSTYFLFTPSAEAGAMYMLFWFFALYFSWTVMEIPYRAWSSELTGDYTERSRISTYIASMGAIGTVAFMSIPLLPIFQSTEINADTLKVMALLIVVLLPTMTTIAVWKSGRGAELTHGARAGITGALQSFRHNGALQIFTTSFVFGGLASGLFLALFYIYVDSYLMIGGSFALLYVLNAGANFVGLPIWYFIMKKTGKHLALAASWLVYAALLLIMALFVQPGPNALAPMIVLAITIGLAEAAIKVSPYAIVGDIVDVEILRSNVNRAGSYFAVLTLVAKLNFAIGGGVGFLLLGLIGYSVGATNDPLANIGFLAVFAGLPALLYAIATAIIVRFPLNKQRQSEIRRQIEERAAQEPSPSTAPPP